MVCHQRTTVSLAAVCLAGSLGEGVAVGVALGVAIVGVGEAVGTPPLGTQAARGSKVRSAMARVAGRGCVIVVS